MSWFSDIGIHTGQKCRVRFHETDEPVHFLKNGVLIPASVNFVSDTKLSTTLSFAGQSISMVEHLLAALHILGIWHGLLIEVEGPEIPIFDGSAIFWAEVLEDFPQKPIQPIFPKKISLDLNGTLLTTEPGEMELSVSIDFPKPIGHQTWRGKKEDFSRLLDARTFGFLADVAPAQAAGKALGLKENAVLYDEIGPNLPVRGDDEPVRHKALDLLGDLYLAGAPLEAKISVHKGSHNAHVALTRKILG